MGAEVFVCLVPALLVGPVLGELVWIFLVVLAVVGALSFAVLRVPGALAGSETLFAVVPVAVAAFVEI